MKITYLITRFDSTGGAQVHVHDLGVALHHAGHDVRVITGAAGPLSKSLEASGVTIDVVPDLHRAIRFRDDLRATSRIRRLLRQIRPDIISCHSSKAGVIGRLAARGLAVPVIFTAHGWAFTQGVPTTSRILYGAVEALLAPFADAIVAVSDNDRELARVWLPHARRRVEVIRNGVNDVEPSLRADAGASPPVATFVGRFGPQKDHRIALEALARVPGVRLQLVGDGPGRERIVADIGRLGLEDRVALLGQRTDVAALLSESQIFLLFSRWEGLPRSIIEGMRAGLPILASDVGGVGELVTDGVNGRLVRPGDIDAARRALEDLVSRPSVRSAMGHAARRRYEAEFTFDRMYRETTDLYRRLTTARPS